MVIPVNEGHKSALEEGLSDHLFQTQISILKPQLLISTPEINS